MVSISSYCLGLVSDVRIQVTLHLSGTKRYWTVDNELAALFGHPTITSLTISCVEIHEDGLERLTNVVKTPLEQLSFIECNLTTEALHLILSRPRALSQLYLGVLLQLTGNLSPSTNPS